MKKRSFFIFPVHTTNPTGINPVARVVRAHILVSVAYI